MKPARGTIPVWALPLPCKDVPDLVLCLGWDDSQPPPVTRLQRAGITFVLADVTYTVGYGARAAIKRKQFKYAHLVAALRAQGFTVIGFQEETCSLPDKRSAVPHVESDFSSVGVLCFGITGEIYHSSKSVLKAYGMTSDDVTTALGKIHALSIRNALRILKTRSMLDGKTGTSTPQHPGQPGSVTARHNDTQTHKRKRHSGSPKHRHLVTKKPRGIG